MIDSLFELVLILGFWQIINLIPMVLRIVKLEKFIPKVHPISKFIFFFFVLYPLNPAKELSDEFSILNKFSICISSWYSYTILVTKIMVILIPVLLVLKMLGVDLEKIKSWFDDGGSGYKAGSGVSRRNHDNIIGSETNRWPHLRASNMHRRR